MPRKRGVFGTIFAVALLAASTASAADDFWAHGCWQNGIWGGVCIRPDGYVTESDPDGNIKDIGRWYKIDDDTIWWFLACWPEKTHVLHSDGLYEVEFTRGYTEPPQDLKRAFVPDEYDALWISWPSDPVTLVFPEDWK